MDFAALLDIIKKALGAGFVVGFYDQPKEGYINAVLNIDIPAVRIETPYLHLTKDLGFMEVKLYVKLY